MTKIKDLKAVTAWALSPSDFAFLWDECPYCFYSKVVLKKGRPRTPFPKVFGIIDSAMKDFYLGERAEAIADGLNPGVITGGNRWVKSGLISPPGCSTGCFIRGRIDALLQCDEGSVGVIDFKTSEPKADHIPTYGRQLHAYAHALENPFSGLPATVSSLGLLCFMPGSYQAKSQRAALSGDLTWIEVERDEAAFLEFLAEVVTVLEQPTPPAASPSCTWCGWRAEVLKAAS